MEASHPHPERLPTQAKLCAFLASVGAPDACKHLAPKNEGREHDPRYPWTAETVLLDQLYRLQARSPQAMAQINEVRSHVYAATWESGPPPKPDAVQAALPVLRALVKDTVRAVEQAGPTDVDARRDAEELRDELNLALHLIEQALRDRPCDDEAEPSTRAIERLYGIAWLDLTRTMRRANVLWDNWQTAKKPMREELERLIRRIEAIRPARNLLYYDRAYKTWCQIAHNS